MRKLLVCLLCFVLAGCGIFEHKDTSEVSRPDTAMGTGARIMYPGSRGPAMPGAAGAPTGAGPESGTGTDITMIGGHSTEGSYDKKERTLPILGPIGVLFGYPFWIFGKTVSEKADIEKKQQMSERSGAATPDEAERERVQRENAEMERELLNRGAQAPTAASPAPKAALAGGSSIADEIAALERRRASSPAPATSTPAPTPATEWAAAGSPRETADRNGDGQADLWAYYDGTKLSREVLDDNHDGQADRVLHYSDGTKLARVEEDTDGDGRLESTSLFEDGRISRKRADQNGDGQADSWSFFRAGELARHELDRDGDGFRDVVTTYEDGGLAREEEDRNGDGRPDLVVRYRGGEVAERHEDLDYDGKPDVASFYEGGKLVRRELHSAESLDRWSPGESR